MAIVWGAYVTASGGYGMRVGIDLSFSAVSHASATCTATYKLYTQNSGTWDPPDLQQFEFDGNYNLPQIFEFENVGTTATKGDIIYRCTKTYTFTYGPNMYGTTQLPQEADLIVDVIHTRPLYYPHCEVHVLFPIRPYAAPAVPSAIALARVSDVNNKVSWTNHATPGEPYDAIWLERYIYLGPGMVSGTGIGSWTRIATLAKTVVTYNDTAAVANRKYTYRVQADNSVGTSAYVQSAIMYTSPAAPTSVDRTIVAGNQVLTWVQGVGYTEYETEVWRSVDGVYSLLTTLATGVTTYTDTTAKTNQRVKYKLRTKTTANPTVLYSVDSAETTETTGVPTAPAAPTNTKPATGTIDPTANTTHTWTHNPTDGSLQTYFEVQYRHVGDAVWKTSGKIASGTSSWVMPKNSVSKGNVVEWQVRTYGFSSTLASPWSALTKWTTSPAIPLKYPMFLDLDTGRTEADSKITLITEQTRRVATVKRETSTTNATAVYNILSYTLPVALARTGKRFRFFAQCSLVGDTAGMYTDLSIRIGVGVVTGGWTIAAHYADQQTASRARGFTFVGEYTFDPATAGGENIATINIVLQGTPVGGGSLVQQAAGRAAYLIIDEIIEGQSTASSGGSPPAASTVQIVAGNGLFGGGDLTSNRAIDLVSEDNTLVVKPDSVKVNTAVMATRAYAEGLALGGPGGSSGENEVWIDIVEPVPVAGHPEIWIDLDDDTGGLKPSVSGVWGTAPLDIYGSNTLLGRETYIDAQGKMRSKPEEITGRKVDDLSTAYPPGTSIQYIAGADAANWPGGRQLVTQKTSNGLAAQWLYNWSAAVTKVWYRNSTSTGWSPWVVVADSTPPVSNDTGWIDLAFEDPWINYPTSYQNCKYRKIGNQVFVRGLARTTVALTASSAIGILPVGFRPLLAEIFNASVNITQITGAASTGTAHTHSGSYNTACRIDVAANGNISATIGPSFNLPVSAYLSLSGVSFFTD